MMRLCVIAALTAATLSAAYEQRLALAIQAQSQFDRVELAAAAPDLRDTIQCTQAQAALLPVALPEELAALHYRKGFCTLAGAAITRNTAQFADAAAEFAIPASPSAA